MGENQSDPIKMLYFFGILWFNKGRREAKRI
jgi:hypothetical protein